MLVEFGEPKNDISIISKKLISNKVLTKKFLTKKIITIFAFNSNEKRNDYDRKSI